MHRAIDSKLAGLGIAALALASGAAQAEVTATFTAASNYDFRGITQTALDPALQASIDWVGENGVYASLWGSNIDFGTYEITDPYVPPPGEPVPDPVANVDLNIEIDAVLGYAGSFTEEFGYDVGTTYYKYLGNDDEGVNNFDYAEVFGGLNGKLLSADVSAKVWYAWDYSNSGESAWYGELNGDIPLPWWDLGVTAHAGYSDGNYWTSDDTGLDSYLDWSLGLIRSFGRFDFAVKYIDGSDLKEADCSLASVECGGEPAFSSQSTVYFSVATTFPWGKEE